LSKDRALAAEEAQVAKEELIESLEEALDTKRRLVATAEKVIEETRANLVSVQEQCNEEARAAKALQDELGAAHAKLAKAIETQHEGPAGREIETLRAQADSLAAQLREVNERAGESERRLRQHEALEKCASRDLMRSETDVQEQEKELFSLRVQFMGQAERLEAMHARCEAECERNEVLNARIRELNAKIFAARAGRGEGGEKPGPEEAEDGIGSQDNKVKMLEARLLDEAREKAALRSQIAALKKGVSAQRTAKPFGRIGSGLKMKRTGSGAASSLRSGGGGSRTSAATSPAALTKATGKKLTALASSNRRVKTDKISQEAAAARKTHARRLTDQVSVTASMSVDVDGGMDVELEYNDDSWTATEGWSSSEYDSSSWTQEESFSTAASAGKGRRGSKPQTGWFHQMMAGAMGGDDEDDEETLGTSETPSTYERSLSAREGSIRTREGSLVSTATESSAVSGRSRRRRPRPPASRFRRNNAGVRPAASDGTESSAADDDAAVGEDDATYETTGCTTVGDGTRSVTISPAESGLMSSVMNWFGGGGGGREGAAGNSDFSRESVGGGGGALLVQ